MELTQGNALNVKDLSEVAKPFLSPAAAQAMSRRSDRLLVLEDGKTYEAIFITRRFKESSEAKAAQAVAEELNKLASAGLIHSVLAPISSIKLARMPGEESSIAAFCYPLVPQARMAEVDALVRHQAMENFGQADEDLSLDLPEGDFCAVINLSPTRAMVTEETLESMLKDEICQYTSVLPPGTSVVSTTRCAILTLAIPYEVIFRNPIMKDFRKVELSHRREAAIVNGKLEEFDLLTKITYVRRDGTTVGG